MYRLLAICVFLFTLSCQVNPFEKLPFDNFYNQSISLEGNLIFYNFNETAYTGLPGDIIDNSGRDRHSTSYGDLSKAQGIYGTGIYCNNGSGVNLQVSEFDSAFSERTISVWFAAETVDGIRYVFEEGGGINGINVYIQDGLLYGHTYKNWSGGGSDYQQWHTYPVEVDTWYHVVIWFHRDDGFVMYVNGEAVGSALPLGLDMPAHSNPNALCIQNSDSVRHDVRENNNTGGHPFQGVLDELAVWNRTLSDEEIMNLYLRQGRL